jgi:TonB family protein
MKPLIVFCSIALLSFFAACTSSQYSADLTLPQLIYQHPLPSFPKTVPSPFLRIPLEIRVLKDGTVSDVRIISGSGITAWDSAALLAIRQWKYSPARISGSPVSIWLHQTAVVQFSEPKFMSLAEIICSGQEQADSAYALLEQGNTFSEAVRRFSVSRSRDSGGQLGTVNVQIYPEAIKNILTRLDVGEYTRPIPFGEQYAIFLRVAQ